MSLQEPVPSAAPATQTETVTEAKRPELQSGETLLVEAYVAIWAITFLFIFFAWRRTRSLEDKLAMIEGGLAKARAAQEKSSAGTTDATVRRAPEES